MYIPTGSPSMKGTPALVKFLIILYHIWAYLSSDMKIGLVKCKRLQILYYCIIVLVQ